MREPRRLVTLILFLSLIMIGFSTAAAHEAEVRSGDIRLTFRISSASPGGEGSERTYQMVVTPGGRPVQLTQGFRVPIPTTSFNTQAAEGGNVVPVTSYSYQNVGFTANAEVELTAGGRIHISAHVEDSSIADGETHPGQPMIATVNQRLEVTLKDGASTRVGWVENSEFGSMFLEITAEILD